MGDFVEVEVPPGRMIRDDQGLKQPGQIARVPDFQYREELGRVVKGKPAPEKERAAVVNALRPRKGERGKTNFEGEVTGDE